MITSLSPSTNTSSNAPIAPVTGTNSNSATGKSSAPKSDQVHLSAAALATLQEAMETPAQTAKEAHAGDHQAQRLLAKQNQASATTHVKA